MEQAEGIGQSLEQKSSLDSALQETSGKFWEITRELQRKKPELFNPPTSAAFEENRASLPWPLNQKGAGIYFREAGNHQYGFQIKWEDEKGVNIINLGFDWISDLGKDPASQYKPEDPYYLQDFDETKKRNVYYERICGDEILTYANGKLSDFTAGVPMTEIPMREAAAGQWIISNDAIRLNTILDNLEKYAATLSNPD